MTPGGSRRITGSSKFTALECPKIVRRITADHADSEFPFRFNYIQSVIPVIRHFRQDQQEFEARRRRIPDDVGETGGSRGSRGLSQ